MTKTADKMVQMPIGTLDKVFREVSQALHELGLDVNLEEKDDVAELNYEDLL
jgi:hypothetical protein